MIDTQPEIEWKMRPYLLDFLTRSHLSLRLNHETLFLAINIIDRYASQRIVFVRHYQLLGATALWIASKYQDKKSRVSTLEELKVLCSNAYDSTMFTQMELHILNTLEWSIGHPTIDLFVDMCFQNPALLISDKDERTKLRHMTLFLCENANYQQEMLNFPPSIIASAAFKLALRMLTLGSSDILAHDKNEGSCINALLQHSSSPTPFLERKYSIPEFSRAYQHISQYHAHLEQQRQRLQLQQQLQLEQQQLQLKQQRLQLEQNQHNHQNQTKERNITPIRSCNNKITTPTRYSFQQQPPQQPIPSTQQQQLTTPIKTHLHFTANPSTSTTASNATNTNTNPTTNTTTTSSTTQVGYMTPPFTPEEGEIPVVQKRTHNQLSRSSSRAVSAQQQLKQQRQEEEEDENDDSDENDENENDNDQDNEEDEKVEYNEEEDEDYNDEQEEEQELEEKEADMAYEYNYKDDLVELEHERVQLEQQSKTNKHGGVYEDYYSSDLESVDSIRSSSVGSLSVGSFNSGSVNSSVRSFTSTGSKTGMSSSTSVPSISSFVTSNGSNCSLFSVPCSNDENNSTPLVSEKTVNNTINSNNNSSSSINVDNSNTNSSSSWPIHHQPKPLPQLPVSQKASLFQFNNNNKNLHRQSSFTFSNPQVDVRPSSNFVSNNMKNNYNNYNVGNNSNNVSSYNKYNSTNYNVNSYGSSNNVAFVNPATLSKSSSFHFKSHSVSNRRQIISHSRSYHYLTSLSSSSNVSSNPSYSSSSSSSNKSSQYF